MKSSIAFFIWLQFGFMVNLFCQNGMPGLNYQGAIRNKEGLVRANTSVLLKIALASKYNPDLPFYSEWQRVNTDQNGMFRITIGEGRSEYGHFKDIPWSKEPIWLHVYMSNPADEHSLLPLNSEQLFTVPYAIHAFSAQNLIPSSDSLAKSASPYWNTSGNSGSNPAVHFVGTSDNMPFSIRTNNIPFATLTTDGKLALLPRNAAGPDYDKSSYALVVGGTLNNQGMWVKINGTASTSNNYLTFVDKDSIQGRVEGQTLQELLASGEYKTMEDVFFLQGVSLVASAAAAGLIASGHAAGSAAAAAAVVPTLGASTPAIFGLAAASVAKAATISAFVIEAAALLTESIAWRTQIKGNVGVTYSSGAGDYAEWLPFKTGERPLQFGDVVGVKGGKVSLFTDKADHFMVVSKKPIVVGNLPNPGQEKNFVPIAFLGQVPVKVIGAVKIGDYILPSGNNDGYGVAVSPSRIKVEEYPKIVGVAWENAPEAPLNIVKIAVGINNNDVAQAVDSLDQKADQIIAYLEGKGPLPKSSKVESVNNLVLPVLPEAKPLPTDPRAFDQFIDQQAGLISQIFEQVKSNIKAKGIVISDFPDIEALLNNPQVSMKKLRRNTQYSTYWAAIDQMIANGF